jgi:hypothetical protein
MNVDRSLTLPPFYLFCNDDASGAYEGKLAALFLLGKAGVIPTVTAIEANFEKRFAVSALSHPFQQSTGVLFPVVPHIQLAGC